MRIWTGRDPEIALVHCAGCGRRLGVAPVYRRVFRRMFCDEVCWHRPKVYDMENAARDRHIRLLYLSLRISQPKIAKIFGVSRSWVQQLCAQGNDVDYLLDQPTVTSETSRDNLALAGKAGGNKRWHPDEK